MLFRDFCFLFSQRDRVKFILLNVMLVCCSFIEMATLGSVPLFVAPISVNIHQKESFNKEILDYVRKNHRYS